MQYLGRKKKNCSTKQNMVKKGGMLCFSSLMWAKRNLFVFRYRRNRILNNSSYLE